MIGFGSHQRFYLYRSSVDMRKGLWSLGGIVRQELKADPMDGSVYVFFSRSYQTVKMLVWDGDGFVVYMKRLERGRFESLTSVEGEIKYEISYQHLVMLLSGISLVGMHHRLRYRPTNPPVLQGTPVAEVTGGSGTV
jgi:hypothetical protein